MAGKKDIVEQALKLITEGAAQSSAKQRMIKNLKGHAIAPPREFFRGTVPNSTERIVTGAPEWDSYLFAADNEDAARLYGPSIERIKANPDAKILYEGTADWNKIAGKWRKNENMLQYADRAAKAAREAGYDAAWFKRQGDIGTPIFNVDKFTRGKSEGGRTGYQTKGRVIGDAVGAAMRLVMGGSDEAAKSGIKTYHGTPQPTENLIDLFHGTTPEAFDAITSSGNIFGSSRFSPRRDVAETFAYNVGGDDNTVVKVKAPASSLMIDLDLPNAKLLTPDQAAAYLDKPDWTILDFIENGYSVGVPDTSVLSIDRAAGGRTGFYGNNSISGALNVARGMNGGK